MKSTVLTLTFAAALLAASCSQNNKPDSSGSADYAETYDELIQNKSDSTSSNSTSPMDGPSLATDTAKADSAQNNRKPQ